jgi:hypothetical protein
MFRKNLQPGCEVILNPRRATMLAGLCGKLVQQGHKVKKPIPYLPAELKMMYPLLCSGV